MGGRHIFMGYLNDPARTSETINKEGFLCTGDIGHVDKYGFVYITGRIKVKYFNKPFIRLIKSTRSFSS